MEQYIISMKGRKGIENKNGTAHKLMLAVLSYEW